MLKFRLLVLLPALTLLVSAAAVFYMTSEIARDALEDIEGNLKHVAKHHIQTARRLLLEEDAAETASLAPEMSKWIAIMRTHAAEDPTAEPTPLPAGDPELLKRLQVAAGDPPGTFAALIDTSFRPLGASAPDKLLERACLDSPVLRSAFNWRIEGTLTFADAWAYSLSAAPVANGGVVVAALCVMRRFNDGTARRFKKFIETEITLTSSGALLGTSIRESSPDLLSELLLKRHGTTGLGKFSGRRAPFFVSLPAVLAVDAHSAVEISNGIVSATLTAPVEPAIKDLRTKQAIMSLAALVLLLISVMIAASVYWTISKSVSVCASTLSAVSEGNLQAQVQPGRLGVPFNRLGEAINHEIFAIRERAGRFHTKPKIDLKEVLGTPKAEPEQATEAQGAPQPAMMLSSEPAPELEVPPPAETRPAAPEETDESLLYAAVPVRETPPPAVEQPAELDAETRVPGTDEQVPAELSEPRTSPPHAPPMSEVIEAPAPPEEDLPPTQMVQVSPGLLKSLLDEESLDKVYRDFIDLRGKLGEKGTAISRERFIEKLKRTRDDVVARIGAKEVRFSVYAKEGKASIKATPVK